MIIDFTPDGQAQALHRDEFDLGFLGSKAIERATEIKFNEQTQKWGIWLHRGDHHWNQDWTRFNPPLPEAADFPTYNIARVVEVEWLDRCRFHGYQPDSVEGRVWLLAIKQELGLRREVGL